MSEKKPGRDLTRKFRNAGDEFSYDAIKVFAESNKGQRNLGPEEHKGGHKIRYSTHWDGFALLETEKRFGSGMDVHSLAEKRQGAIGGSAGPLAQAGAVEETVTLVIEIQTDNPGKMHATIAKLAKVRATEADVGKWRALVEVPARSQDEFLGKVASFAGEGFRSMKVPREKASNVLEEGMALLTGDHFTPFSVKILYHPLMGGRPPEVGQIQKLLFSSFHKSRQKSEIFSSRLDLSVLLQ